MATKGFKEAAANMKKRARNLRGQAGTLYPDLSTIMQSAIENNSDDSYTGSPALTMAIKSAKKWIHQPLWHLLKIISTLYANYRQYGCGGIAIVILVKVLPGDRKKMEAAFQKAFRV